MSQDEVARTVADQFRRTLGMFREAVLAFPADEWRSGELDYLRPAGIAYHLLETIDFYTGDQPADQFAWGGRFGVGWESRQPERLPDQQQVITYLDEMETKLAGWFAATDLTAAEERFPWTGPSVLGRAIYLLRNTQHHLAEMSLELTRRGCDSPDWK